jgi:hypothetical protein
LRCEGRGSNKALKKAIKVRVSLKFMFCALNTTNPSRMRRQDMQETLEMHTEFLVSNSETAH